MQLNNFLKSLMIVLPLLTLGACSSTSETDVAETSEESSAVIDDGNSGAIETGSVDTVTVGDNQNSDGSASMQLQQLQQENTIFFPYDNYEIQGQYATLLDSHANYLRTNPATKVLIEGHADERGTPEYNIALGERRAQAVARYLQTLGVQAEQLSIVSYGEEKPLDMGHGEDSFAKNRRAVLIY